MDWLFRIGYFERQVIALQTQALCKSIFKDGRTETTRKIFTSQLTKLINQLEKSKSIQK